MSAAVYAESAAAVTARVEPPPTTTTRPRGSEFPLQREHGRLESFEVAAATMARIGPEVRAALRLLGLYLSDDMVILLLTLERDTGDGRRVMVSTLHSAIVGTNTSYQLRQLVEQGLAEIVDDSMDRRRRWVAITHAGRGALARLREALA